MENDPVFNPVGTLEAVNLLCDEVAAVAGILLGRHWDDCYLSHAPCLAQRIQDIQTGLA